jgi:hypothetical protein
MKVNKSGFRKDIKPFFNQYVLTIPSSQRQPSPFLVVDEETVMKCNTVDELLEYSDKIGVLQTWPGKKKSDVFYFTVKDLRKHIEKGG